MNRGARTVRWVATAGILVAVLWVGVGVWKKPRTLPQEAVLAPAQAPQRIITLAPSLGELAADLLGDELSRIVGVTEFTDYPPALKKVTSIGRFDRFQLEQVVALKPDLVLATQDGNSADQIQRLRELGIPVLVVETQGFTEIAKSMVDVGRALGVEARGQAMSQQFLAGIERLRERGRNRTSRPRVLLQVGMDPLVVAGGQSFLSAGLEVIGAENVFGNSREAYVRPSLESAVAAQPEQIILLCMTGREDVEPGLKSSLATWSRFQQIPAVAQGKVKPLAIDSLLRPSMRLLEGLSVLEGLVHGTGRSS